MTAYSDYLEPVFGARALLVGDSNLVFDASQVIQASSGYPGAPAELVSCDFGAAVPGIGLRDLGALLARIDACQPAGFDVALVNLGVADLILEDADWAAFFAAPPAYATRIQLVLDALEPLPVYWIGAPSGLNSPPCHPWEIAAVDLTLAGFDAAYPEYAAWSAPHGADPRMHYHSPDAAIGATSPRFLDGLHYTPAAAAALYASVFARLRTELA